MINKEIIEDYKLNPMLLLLALPGRIREESRLVSQAKKDGYQIRIARDLDELSRLLPEDKSRYVILIAERETACRGKQDVDSYTEFLKIYASMRKVYDIDIVIIMSYQKTLDNMIGYGDLVSAYMRLPLNVKMLMGFIRRMHEHNKEKKL